MKKHSQILFRFSIIFNVILVIAILYLLSELREKIYNKMATITSNEKVLSIISPYSIVMLGNSITEDGIWDKDLNRDDVVNSGVGGFTTSHLVLILDDHVLWFKPKICFIEGGINDIFVGISLPRVYKNYESIIDTLLKYNIEPVLQSTLFINQPGDSVINSKVDSINYFLQNLALKKNILYLDLNQFFSENKRLKEEFSKDGVHIKENAYKIWAREIDKILEIKRI